MKNFEKRGYIGLFDSGIGGLSVWREALKIMPDHHYLYYSDNGNAPYGPKESEEIVERSFKISQFLISKGAEVIVVACNTATAAAIATLRESFSVPFVGMEPAIKPAATLTKSGVVGILATKGTLQAPLYNGTLNRYAKEIEVVEMVGKGLVELIESGVTKGEQLEALLTSYIVPMVERGADQIVLGCTHYPFIREAIERVAGAGVGVIDPAPAVAKRAHSLVEENPSLFLKSEGGESLFYHSGDGRVLMEMVEQIAGTAKLSSFNRESLDR